MKSSKKRSLVSKTILDFWHHPLDIPGSYGDKVGIIGRSRNGDTSSAPEIFARKF